MIKNFLKTAWRNIIRNKAYSAINILGLATGMAVALLIGLWVYQEYSFDKFLPEYQHAYKVKVNFTHDGGMHTQDAVSVALVAALRNTAGIKYVAESDWGGEHSLIVKETKLVHYGSMVAP